MRDFRTLAVWRKSHALTLMVYAEAKSFPRDEQFGLASQVRRSAASIAANIAEGCGRHGAADFARFLDIAVGSASELEYHLLLARDLGYIATETHADLEANVTEVRRMLFALTRTLRPDRDER